MKMTVFSRTLRGASVFLVLGIGACSFVDDTDFYGYEEEYAIPEPDMVPVMPDDKPGRTVDEMLALPTAPVTVKKAVYVSVPEKERSYEQTGRFGSKEKISLRKGLNIPDSGILYSSQKRKKAEEVRPLEVKKPEKDEIQVVSEEEMLAQIIAPKRTAVEMIEVVPAQTETVPVQMSALKELTVVPAPSPVPEEKTPVPAQEVVSAEQKVVPAQEAVSAEQKVAQEQEVVSLKWPLPPAQLPLLKEGEAVKQDEYIMLAAPMISTPAKEKVPEKIVLREFWKDAGPETDEDGRTAFAMAREEEEIVLVPPVKWHEAGREDQSFTLIPPSQERIVLIPPSEERIVLIRPEYEPSIEIFLDE